MKLKLPYSALFFGVTTQPLLNFAVSIIIGLEFYHPTGQAVTVNVLK